MFRYRDPSFCARSSQPRGRVLLAVERYKEGEASLGKAASLAGISVAQMLATLAEFGVEARIDEQDYLQGLRNLEKAW